MTILKTFKALLKDGNVYTIDQLYMGGQEFKWRLTDNNGESKIINYNKYYDLEPLSSDNIFKNS